VQTVVGQKYADAVVNNKNLLSQKKVPERRGDLDLVSQSEDGKLGQKWRRIPRACLCM